MPSSVDSVFLAGPRPLLERLSGWLREACTVWTTTDPSAVPREIDPDVAIVDCRPPTSDLDALTAAVDDNCQIAAVVRDPPFAAAAHPLPIDGVLVEPLSRSQVAKTVERFDRRRAYEETLERLPSVATTRAAANETVQSSVPGTASTYDPVRVAWTVAETSAANRLAEFDAGDFRAVFRRSEFRDSDAENGSEGDAGSA